MKLYTSTGTIKIRDQCNEYGVGLLMVNTWRDPDKWPFFAVDNGCYSAYSRNEEWEPQRFIGILSRMRRESRMPDFVVIPDKVADPGSMAFSDSWATALRASFPGFPYYLAVQDGMSEEDVVAFHEKHGISGLFVGGSTEWKLETMGKWSQLAHSLGLECHVGRIGPVNRMLLAEYSGADSIDSTTWVQRRDVLPKYIEGYRNQSAYHAGGME